MTTDSQVIRAEKHPRIGHLIQRDAALIIDRWAQRASAEQPLAQRLHQPALLDDLPKFLLELGRSLAEVDDGITSRHRQPAREHGQQRWDNGWSLSEVVRDYQILRLVILDYLDEVLDRPLRAYEVMAIGLALDEAITASVNSYVQIQAEAIREVERSRAEREKEAEEALHRRQAEALQEMNRRKDEFLAILGHELRNPLAPFRNSLYVLRERGREPATLEWALGVMERQTEQLTHLVDDLLDISRLGRGKTRLHPERLDLVSLLRRRLDDQRPTLEAAGVILEVSLPPEPVWVTADPTRLAQVVDNLLTNAAKFTNREGRVLVQLSAEPASSRCAFSIKDTGIGIEAELLPQIFDVFMQADRSLHRSKGGLGLGLALVKGLVELHGGSVTAVSDGPGQGTKFTVTLPLASEQGATAATPLQAPPLRKVLRVLIIDDNADAADSLRMLLEAQGQRVGVAYAGPAALEMAPRFGPDVVLCDLGLPGMDGYAVGRALRQDPQTAGAYLIALSGYGSDSDRQKAREAGFQQYLVKPCEPELLMAALAAVSK